MVEKKKGEVKFRPPEVQVVADMPGDDEMREKLDEMKTNDGYEGSCGPDQRNRKQNHAEKLRYENADKIYE